MKKYIFIISIIIIIILLIIMIQINNIKENNLSKLDIDFINLNIDKIYEYLDNETNDILRTNDGKIFSSFEVFGIKNNYIFICF